MATAQQAISLAAAQIGISGTNNKFNTWYWGYPCYDANTYPWCAAFQSWIADQLGGLGFNYSASVSGIIGQLKQVSISEVRPGDYVAFNWNGRTSHSWMDHIGIIEWAPAASGGYFGTIEGNASGAPGGICKRLTRSTQGGYYVAFFRPVYDGAPAPTPTPPVPSDKVQIKYKSYSRKQGWLNTIVDRYDTGGSGDTYSGDGSPILYLAIDMPGWYQVKTRRQGWRNRIRRYDPNDLETGCAGDGSEITAVRCFYETQDANKTGWIRIRYAVANVGQNFMPEMEDLNSTDGSRDDYAGNGGTISAFYAYPKRV